MQDRGLSFSEQPLYVATHESEKIAVSAEQVRDTVCRGCSYYEQYLRLRAVKGFVHYIMLQYRMATCIS
jgi:hypothetical protein